MAAGRILATQLQQPVTSACCPARLRLMLERSSRASRTAIKELRLTKVLTSPVRRRGLPARVSGPSWPRELAYGRDLVRTQQASVTLTPWIFMRMTSPTPPREPADFRRLFVPPLTRLHQLA